jgi:hypothetical protein
MADVSRLRIPERHSSTIGTLLDLSDENFERLLAALGTEPPVFEADELTERVAAQLPELIDAEAVVELFVVLHLIRQSRDLSVEEFGAVLREAGGMPDDESARERVSERLVQALAVPTLRLTAKAVDLVVSNERTLRSTRIVTELRPVFGDDPADEPRAGVLVHRLELSYVGPDGEWTTFHVAMDDEDVSQLQAAAVRAQAKAHTMTALADRVGIRLPRPKASDGS